jgi:hypothetical protein
MLLTKCLRNGAVTCSSKFLSSFHVWFRGTGRSFEIAPLRKHKRYQQRISFSARPFLERILCVDNESNSTIFSVDIFSSDTFCVNIISATYRHRNRPTLPRTRATLQSSRSTLLNWTFSLRHIDTDIFEVIVSSLFLRNFFATLTFLPCRHSCADVLSTSYRHGSCSDSFAGIFLSVIFLR